MNLSPSAQEEWETQESSFREDDTDDDMDDVEEQQEGGSGKNHPRRHSRVLLSPTQPVRATVTFLAGRHYEDRAEDVFV